MTDNRWQYLVTTLLAGAVLSVARWLPPSPRGVGTHELLGLPPCLFLKLTGFPCPSCGMTTCFAHAAKLHFYDALMTQPFGLLLFFGTVLAIPLSVLLAYRQVPWADIATSHAAKRITKLTLILWLLGWGGKLLLLHQTFH